jgi:hypothetical protein
MDIAAELGSFLYRWVLFRRNGWCLVPGSAHVWIGQSTWKGWIPETRFAGGHA